MLEHRGWYERLRDDCQEIREGGRVTRLGSLKAKWQLGQRIAEDPDFEQNKGGRGQKGFVGQLAADLGIAKRELNRFVQFFRQTPDLALDTDEPEGETESRVTQLLDPPKAGVPPWRWVVNVYLPGAKAVTPEYRVTDDIIEAAAEVLGQIDLDPFCPHGPNVPAKAHLDGDQDSQAQWAGRVFLVPPTGQATGRWIMKLIAQFESKVTIAALLLAPAITDAKWFPLLRDYSRCFLLPGPHLGGVRSPHMVVYLGDRQDEFTKHFSRLGDVYAPADQSAETSGRPQNGTGGSIRPSEDRLISQLAKVDQRITSLRGEIRAATSDATLILPREENRDVPRL